MNLEVNLGALYRHEYGRILASLIRAFRDFDLAEDALQEAFAAALAQWPAQGPPQHRVAWLLATARHKAIDLLRRLGRHADAAAAYQHALALVTNAAERRFLERRLAEVTRPTP